METPKVNILLSTYNGEKYLEEQLESLFAQEYPNLDIYVRDDGSSDSTVAILERYEKQGKLRLIRGENLGYCGSFFSLLRLAEDGDYWSFCDQDDLWYRDKVRRAVGHLEREKKDGSVGPLLYYSFSRMVNEKGEELGIQRPPSGSLCFRRALTGTFGVGFSMVIDRALRDAMLECDPQRVHAHDWLAGAIALGFGKVIVDRKVCADYRRLDTSVTRVSFLRRVQWFWKSLCEESDVRERNVEFSRHFYGKLSRKNQRLMQLFDKRQNFFMGTVIKLFYPGRWRPSLGSELSMRFLMMIGRV